jgi:hypothetical protein
MDEFEKMFKHKPFSDLDPEKISQDEIKAAMSEAIQSATFHFGEGRMNPSTIACVLRQVEEHFLKKCT